MTIAEGVELQNGVMVATDNCPWLRLSVDASRLAGRWVRLTYVSGLLEPLARPVLRCFVGDSHTDEILPAALFGRAIWLGRIPEGTTAIWISPTNQPGPFAFAIEKLRVETRARLLWRVFWREPGRAWVCLWARVIGMRHLAQLQVKRTLGATPLRHYDRWLRARTRPFDPGGFDRQGPSAGRKPHIRFVAPFSAAAKPGVLALLAQLSAQPYPHWSLAVVGAEAADFANANRDVHRLLFVAPGASTLGDLRDDDFVATLAPGDLVPDYALTALARAAGDHPEIDVFYGDEDSIDGRGRRAAPCLKSDWSPMPFLASSAIGAPCMVKVRTARKSAEAGVLSGALACNPGAVRHVRRVLRTRACAEPCAANTPAETRETPLESPSGAPRASIIVATRDRLDLFARCIEGLKSATRLGGAEVLVVDNDSARDDTKAYLADLARDARFRILHMPGPFNFSRLCNQGAAAARAPVLVFLNNDTEIIDETWLDILLAFTAHSDVGAVGAKLLYPNGRVQHAGVVLGIDGRAGHFERGIAASDPGYFGRLNMPHPVCAVTAACLAVEAKKFFAVGGFDEVNLPVELNDVDLCLRLNERGWKTLCAPAAQLIHRESASRGASVRPDERYGAQHDYFRARWLAVLRDDPYFHPGLSLDVLHPALG
ncbi:glycosyltransferase family 2 protein [Methylocapsa sp. S129]|uniref:glycosyltransferase family 2 protein n=1 Tax=Methylocapsa sp. S129 TaxID=1641869 RepID=UPI00131D297E|nr:glycosyltransferase family 2 protein [Methylocapsa sp. S129]